MEMKENLSEIKLVKTENDQMEANIDGLRRQNEKLAKAIRRVKDDPNVHEEAKQRALDGDSGIEKELKSEELKRAMQELVV